MKAAFCKRVVFGLKTIIMISQKIKLNNNPSHFYKLLLWLVAGFKN